MDSFVEGCKIRIKQLFSPFAKAWDILSDGYRALKVRAFPPKVYLTEEVQKAVNKSILRDTGQAGNLEHLIIKPGRRENDPHAKKWEMPGADILENLEGLRFLTKEARRAPKQIEKEIKSKGDNADIYFLRDQILTVKEAIKTLNSTVSEINKGVRYELGGHAPDNKFTPVIDPTKGEGAKLLKTFKTLAETLTQIAPATERYDFRGDQVMNVEHEFRSLMIVARTLGLSRAQLADIFDIEETDPDKIDAALMRLMGDDPEDEGDIARFKKYFGLPLDAADERQSGNNPAPAA